MKYLYENHLGGLYTLDKHLSIEELYCEQCGDYDWLLGTFNNFKEFWDLIKTDCDIDGDGGYSLQYIYPFVIEEFGLPNLATYVDGDCVNSNEEIIKNINKLLSEYTSKE